MKIGLPLMKNLLTAFAESVLLPLRLMTAASATDAAVQKKMYGSDMTRLTIQNEEMKDIQIVKYLDESLLLNKGVDRTMENEAK